MQRESVRLTQLVKEIIDLSRLQVARHRCTTRELVAVDDVVAEAVDRCRLVADGAARSTLAVVGGRTAPKVYGDAELLVTAVRNLVDNAVAYSPGRHPGRRSACAGSDGLVEISVTDQGIGIAEAEQDRIFERFYRVDPARSRATGGTGLGLAIVKHVVRQPRRRRDGVEPGGSRARPSPCAARRDAGHDLPPSTEPARTR